MTKKYLIGIDGGTQSTKVIVFDLHGNVVCEGRQPLRPMNAPWVGAAEHPDDDLWDSLIIASREAMACFPGDPKDIVGAGLCTIRCCRAYLRADGSLAYPVISWMDIRCEVPFSFPTDDACYATTTTGYMTHRLTGEFKDTVANNMIHQWPVDMTKWNWSDDEELFKAFSIKRDQVFKLCMPGDILGYVTKEASKATGIPEGIPVVATANDKAVEALGAGIMLNNAGLVSLGTYTTSMFKGERLLKDPRNHINNFSCVPNKYLYENPGLHRGMWMISWLRDLFGKGFIDEAAARGISPEALLNEEASKVPPCSDGLMTIPEWLSYPIYKKGIMMGFDVRHGRAHMFRSLMEGIVLAIYNKFSAMCQEVGTFPDKIIASGGGSKGDAFVQIISDVFGLPVERNEVEDAAGMGSAICAAVATDMYPDFESAIEAMVRMRNCFQPNTDNHVLYTKMNEDVYCNITKATDPLLEKAYPLFN